jgi:hypothetical protein
MPLLNIEGISAKLSGAQVWVALALTAGIFTVNILRENKPAEQNEQIYNEVKILSEKVQTMSNRVDANTQSIDTVRHYFVEIKDDMKDHREDISGDFTELINIGRFYIENQRKMSEEQMQEVIESWVKKNGWSMIPMLTVSE